MAWRAWAQVVYADPAVGAELRMDLGEFLHAWAALANQGMVVWATAA